MIFGGASPQVYTVDSDKKHYVVNVQLSYVQSVSYTPQLLVIPGISYNTDAGQTDILALQSYQGNIQLPPIKAVMGTIDFQSDQVKPGFAVGPVIFYCSDTGHMLSVQPYYSQGDAIGGTVQGNAARFRSFRLPLLTKGTTVQIFKLVDVNVGSSTPEIRGRMNLNFLTWDDSPFEFQN
jgi:hypothetical protein